MYVHVSTSIHPEAMDMIADVPAATVYVSGSGTWYQSRVWDEWPAGARADCTMHDIGLAAACLLSGRRPTPSDGRARLDY